MSSDTPDPVCPECGGEYAWVTATAVTSGCWTCTTFGCDQQFKPVDLAQAPSYAILPLPRAT